MADRRDRSLWKLQHDRDQLSTADYKGADIDDSIKKYGGPPCRFCGATMYVLENRGAQVLWGCSTWNCPNNEDNKLKFDVHELDTRYMVNNYGTWRGIEKKYCKGI